MEHNQKITDLIRQVNDIQDEINIPAPILAYKRDEHVELHSTHLDETEQIELVDLINKWDQERQQLIFNKQIDIRESLLDELRELLQSYIPL